MQSVNNWLVLKRREKHLTQIRLSKMLGLSQSMISRIEAGKLPNFEITMKLARILDYKGDEYTLIDARTQERRTFNIIDRRIVRTGERSATILITDDNCVLEIIGKSHLEGGKL